MSKKKLRLQNTGRFRELKNKGIGGKKLKPLVSELKQIESHSFFQNLVKYAVIPVWNEHQREQREKQEHELTPELIYQGHVLQYSIALFEALKRPNDIPLFMELG